MTEREFIPWLFAQFGADVQMEQLVEECGEIIVAASHMRRGRVPFDALLAEMVDASIVIDQFRDLFPDTFAAVRAEKIARQAARMGVTITFDEDGGPQ